MNLYAESSAILSWILGEKDGSRVRAELARAKIIMASDLTILECERALIRLEVSMGVSEATLADRRTLLAEASAHWNLLPVESEILGRARLRFPEEPIRTVDAIHLASALVARSAIADMALLTLDHRVRLNGRRLGFKVLPR